MDSYCVWGGYADAKKPKQLCIKQIAIKIATSPIDRLDIVVWRGVASIHMPIFFLFFWNIKTTTENVNYLFWATSIGSAIPISAMSKLVRAMATPQRGQNTENFRTYSLDSGRKNAINNWMWNEIHVGIVWRRRWRRWLWNEWKMAWRTDTARRPMDSCPV